MSIRTYTIIQAIYFFLLQGVANAALVIKTNCYPNEHEHICLARGSIEYIYIYDEIDTPTYERFMDVASQVPLNKAFPKVYLNSRGGSPIYARQMGRVLRLRSATVEGRDMISPEREPRCASACVELAAGGARRNFVQLQVHKGYLIKRIKGEEYDYKPIPEEELIEAKNYFSEMGINSEIIELINSTSPDKEWVYIRYDAKKPLTEQKIYKLGFLIDESIGKDLEKLHWDGEQDDWSASIAYQKLAENGDGKAAFNLGHRFLYGLDGEDKDYQKAIDWFEKAGRLSDPSGYHMLGYLYDHNDEVVKTDLKKSIEYYKKAAEMGFSGSQNNLAWAYYKGKGINRNVPEAIYWATRSAEQGEPFAYSTLAQIRFDGNGFPKNDIETLKWTLLTLKEFPSGRAKKELEKQLIVLRSRMNEIQIKQATELADKWKPLKDGGPTMRDKNDK
jgi:tetratricopeptide (TPR) repeat protein